MSPKERGPDERGPDDRGPEEPASRGREVGREDPADRSEGPDLNVGLGRSPAGRSEAFLKTGAGRPLDGRLLDGRLLADGPSEPPVRLRSASVGFGAGASDALP